MTFNTLDIQILNTLQKKIKKISTINTFCSDLLLPTKNYKKRFVTVLCRDKEEEETSVEKGLKGDKRKSTRKTETGLADKDDHGGCLILRRCFSGGYRKFRGAMTTGEPWAKEDKLCVRERERIEKISGVVLEMDSLISYL